MELIKKLLLILLPLVFLIPSAYALEIIDKSIAVSVDFTHTGTAGDFVDAYESDVESLIFAEIDNVTPFFTNSEIDSIWTMSADNGKITRVSTWFDLSGNTTLNQNQYDRGYDDYVDALRVTLTTFLNNLGINSYTWELNYKGGTQIVAE